MVNIISHLILGLPTRRFPSGFPTSSFHALFPFPFVSHVLPIALYMLLFTWENFIVPSAFQEIGSYELYFTVVLYGCENRLSWEKSRGLRCSRIMCLERHLGLWETILRECRKLHIAELHVLYSVPNIIRYLKSRCLRWAGHVARIQQFRNADRVLVESSEGKRPLGKSRCRWEDNNKMDLKEGGDTGEWKDLPVR